MKATKYLVLFQDNTSRFFDSLEAVVDLVTYEDGLNMSYYFGDSWDRHYPFHALTDDGDSVMISVA